MVSTQSIKVVLLVTLLVSTFIFSMIPLRFMTLAARQLDQDRRRRYKYILSFLSCYAAGVFLGTCLLDLFPEVQKTMTTALDKVGIVTTFPTAEFIMVFGFFIILIIEQLVLTTQGSHSHSNYEPILDNDVQPYERARNVPRRLFSTDSDISVTFAGTSTRHPTSHPQVNCDHSEILSTEGGHGDFHSVGISSDSEEEMEETPEQDDLKSIEQSYVDPSSHSPIRSFILLMALSLHSIFEGLAIGLQPTNSDVLQIFAPVALHKSIIAFSLGLNLVQSRLSLASTIRSNILFCVASPVGIGIGIAIINFSPDTFITALVNGILQGLACGTFLFVVFFEILPHEFMTSSQYPNRLLKTLFMVLGYATVSVLVLVQPGTVTTRRVCQKSVHCGM